MPTTSYVGRFAPSPTGPLHFGSLVAALASYLDARHEAGRWLLRIEDLDPPRESGTAPREIMKQLTALGLTWDGDVLFQSTRLAAYERALSELHRQGHTYPCTCTRKATPPVYPGTCRDKLPANTPAPFSVRLRIREQTLTFEDRVFGQQSWQPARDLGDFIIKRKDGLFAYQLAVVADDHFQGVNHVVRGSDLLDSTPRQIALFKSLRLPQPEFLHIPILAGKDGQKLSKQAHATPIDAQNPIEALMAALITLGQNVPTGCQSKEELLERAAKDWNIDQIPKKMQQHTPFEFL